MLKTLLRRLIVWAAPKSLYVPLEYKDYAGMANMETQFNIIVTRLNALTKQNEQLTLMYRDLSNGKDISPSSN